MIPTPTLIRQVAANGGISISVNGIARPLDEDRAWGRPHRPHLGSHP